MKTLRQTVLPVLAGLLFAISACWLFANWLSSLLISIFVIPSYLLLVAALLRRRRNHLLTAGTAFMLLYRLYLVHHYRTSAFPESSQPFVPVWTLVAGLYLAGTVLLFAFILVNLVPKLKKYRPHVNPLWLLPGLVMLAGVVLYGLALSPDLLHVAQGLRSAFFALNWMGTPVFDALGTLLIPLWLKLCAPDDLEPYEKMVGQMLTPEQLEEKRLELGLIKMKNGTR